MTLEWSSDGCPNDCGYCRKRNLACVYTEAGKIRSKSCAKCGKAVSDDEIYSYRGFDFCEECIDDGRRLVERQRAKYIYICNHTAMMQTDPSKFKKIQDAYENGILTEKKV